MTEQKYNQLFKEYYAPLRFFAQKIVGELFAEDVVCDTFLKLWEYREHEKENYNAYLYTLTRNRALNLLRSKKYREANPFVIEPPEDDIEAAAMRAELIRMVYNHMLGMPRQRKAIFDLLFFKEMSPFEVSLHLGISVDTVRVVKAQCLSVIRKRIIHV